MALVDLKTNLADWSGKKTPSEANPAPVNFFNKGGNDFAAGAKGFTKNAADVNQSNFIGINRTEYTYPASVNGGRLMKPSINVITYPGPQNFMNDLKSGATGFTKSMEKSQFLGVAGNETSYTYPNTVPPIHRNSVQAVPTKNSKFDQGIAKFDSVIGSGSPFYYLKDGSITSKTFSTGYSWKPGSKYSDKVQSIRGQANKSLLYIKATETNSPSAIDGEYDKFNLRDDSYNPYYIKQPYILRGIQRKDKKEPQRWGGSSLADEGMVRAGIAAATERSFVDLGRISQWLASPKGLLWLTKQTGLGFSNPKLETIVPTPFGQTRIQTGLGILPTIAGTAFGLHFTRHGVPYLNAVDSYENVQKFYKLAEELGGSRNRLIRLRQELIRTPVVNKLNNIPIASLSYFSGPNSAYGIGFTTVKRSVNTNSDTIFGDNKYNYFSQAYSPFVNIKQTATLPTARLNSEIDNEYNGTLSAAARNEAPPSQDMPNPFKPEFPNKPGNETSKDLIDRKGDSTQLYAGNLRANTKHTYDASKDTNHNTVNNVDARTQDEQGQQDGVSSKLSRFAKDDKYTPGAKRGEDKSNNVQLENSKVRDDNGYKNNTTNIHPYAVLAYSQIPKNSTTKTNLKGDFRNAISEQTTITDDVKKSLGISDKLKDYYNNNNLENKKGFGFPAKDRTEPNKFLITGDQFGTVKPYELSNTTGFSGDKITAIDHIRDKPGGASGNIANEVYTNGAKAKDLITFYFKDGDSADGQVMVFRATLTGLSDSFSPSWTRIDIMGRPDGAYMYDSFERSLAFTFNVMAMSRSEMIPMWRKLNFLASYTMPDFAGNNRPSGPFMRLTIGDLFRDCPGFIESLTYTVPDEMTWDIGEAYDGQEEDAKQLPMGIEVSVTYKVVHDFRPDVMGPVYYLFPQDNKNPVNSKNSKGNWLAVSSQKESAKITETKEAEGGGARATKS